MDIDAPVAEAAPAPGGDRSPGSLVAGFLSGAIATSLGHPLDTLKVRRQVSFSAALPPAPAALLPPAPAALLAPAALPPLRQLYRGVLPPMLTAGGVQAVFFVLYERARLALRAADPAAPHYYARTFAAGSMAGVAISLVTNPISLVKVQLQTSAKMGVMQCYKSIYSSRGVRGLYTGMGPMLVMESAGRGAFFACYEFAKNRFSGGADEADVPLWCRMAAASLSGCLSWALIYPMDVVKSRIQMAQPDGGGPTEAVPSARDVARSIYSQSGIRGLYRGLGFTLLRAAPISSIGLPLYEICKQLIAEVAAMGGEGAAVNSRRPTPTPTRTQPATK